jgi:hypothetical protein
MRLFANACFVLLSLAACAAGRKPMVAEVKQTSCADRDGYCFDVSVNGVQVEPIESAARKLAPYIDRMWKAKRIKPDEVLWSLPLPVPCAFTITAVQNSLGRQWFDGDTQSEASIFSLSRVAPDITIRAFHTFDYNGYLIVSPVNTLHQKQALRPGEYLLSVRMQSEKQWDRKSYIYFTCN